MIKEQLLEYCFTYVEERILSAQNAITVAQEAANEEGKSSAGDKYETGRAMMQLEIEKNTSQLLLAKQMLNLLNQIKTFTTQNIVQQGSLVQTTNGFYYIAIGAGIVKMNNLDYYLISQVSPIGQLLKGKKIGDSFVFNNKEFKILSVE
ncbi:MAG: hypothetical protein RLZZ175_1152 [Bacteroidota bacterium]|jgi:transcription elongation GreA/GreB family factor